jgi:hypothetical protein
VIATSNSTAKINGALLERFMAGSGGILPFSGGPTFAMACGELLERLWQAETDQPLPSYWMDWGLYVDESGLSLFSMRRALASMQAAMDLVGAAA